MYCCSLEASFVSSSQTWFACVSWEGGVCVSVSWQGWRESLLRGGHAISMKKNVYNNMKHNCIILIQNRQEEPFFGTDVLTKLN